MLITMRHAITKAQAALAKEKDPKKRKALQSDIKAFRAAIEAAKKETYKKVTEEETSEESGDETDESDGAEEDGNETDRKETDDADPAKDDEGSGEEDEEEGASSKKRSSKKAKKAESEEEEEEARLAAGSEDDESDDSREESAEAEDDEEAKALLGNLKGAKRAQARGVLAALRANAALGEKAYAEVQKLRKERAKTKLHEIIDGKLARRFITRSEAKWLKSQPKATVDSFLATRKGPIVLGEDDAAQPNVSDPNRRYGAIGEFSEDQMKIFKSAAASMNIPVEKLIENYRTNPRATNGATHAASAFKPGALNSGGN